MTHAFTGTVIRLTQEDYDHWRKAFHAIPDFDAWLTKMDIYYAGLEKKDLGNWFLRCSQAAYNEHKRCFREAADGARNRRDDAKNAQLGSTATRPATDEFRAAWLEKHGRPWRHNDMPDWALQGLDLEEPETNVVKLRREA